MNRTTRLAAVYARISTDKQNPLSPADQERKCREYAERNGIAVLDAHVYVDEELSGVGMDRPSLQQMLRAALSPAKPFDVISNPLGRGPIRRLVRRQAAVNRIDAERKKFVEVGIERREAQRFP